MEILNPAILFFSIILITAIFTMFTDIKSKKIYNDHLVIGAVLGLAAIIYTDFWAHGNILFHIINALVAMVIGYCFHRSGIWRGGDAKLFTLYAFLMPALEPDHILFSSAINLFACSFIAGMIIIIPIFINDIASNYNTVIAWLSSPERCKFLFKNVTLTIFLSWIFFPVYYFAGFIHIPAISLGITYLIFYAVRRSLKRIELTKMAEYTTYGSGITIGFLMRLWLSPHSLSWPILPYSILKISLFSALSAYIYATLELFKNNHNRVPFAPLLFIGCALSYTPFLRWITHLVRQ